ncbi:hypothetical protein JCM33374_g3541 [Metschnikowia sp. JCM 33374]|nr:hypothetical protein JCM33374_g3541 [Metschnikowia sp. JCM 33374]
MDNRRVAKVYRDKSHRVKKLPFAPPSGLLSKVKRYFSTSGIPSRIASFTGASDPTKNTQPPETPAPRPNPGFVLPEPFVTADTSTMSQGADDSNRILSSFFQEKGSAPLSQVEYEGVMSLLERSKASMTLPLPESTPEKPAAKALASGAAQNPNNTFSQYSQKVLRNTSNYDPTFTNNSSVLTADYKPVYHTFNDVSRANISMKRVYPFSGVPSPYATRIQAPNFAARKARRIASAAPSVSSMEQVVDASTETSSFKPRSKAANSLLSILDGNTSTQDPDSTAANLGSNKPAKSLHNPYARPKRFTPLPKGDILEKPASPCKADEIAKTVSYNKADELPTNGENGETAKPDDKTSLFGASAGAASVIPAVNTASAPTIEDPHKNPPSEGRATASETADDTTKTSFSFGAPKPNNTLFGTTASSSSSSSGLFGSKSNGLVGESTKSSTSELRNGANGNSTGSADKPPAFSFGAKPSLPTFGQDAKKPSDSEEGQKPPVFNFGANTKEEKPAFTFGSNPNEKAAENSKKTEIETIDVDSQDESDTKESKPSLFSFGAKPAFNFGAKPKEDQPGLSFASNPVEANPKPAFNFGTKKTEDPVSEKPAFNFGAKSVEDKPATDKTAFNFGAKPTAEKPAFKFGSETVGEKPSAEKPTFSFGAKPTGDKPATDKPAFSFGAKPAEDKPATDKPAFSFGSKPTEVKSSTDKPAFSFGSKPAADKPTFGFGAQTTDKTPVAEKPAFSFGAKPAETKPDLAFAFSFGAKPSEEKPATAKPAFNFGSKPIDDKPASPKPTFGFGKQASEQSAPPKPVFNFGAKPAEEKPKGDEAVSVFGTKPNDDKPAFSFGSKPSEKTPTEPTAPKPAFGFGSKPAEEKPVSEKPAFSFGTKPTDVKPAFNFGAKLSEDKAISEKPAFGFGSKPTEEKADANKAAFNFGSKPAQDQSTITKPAFSFGAKPAEEKPADENPAEEKPAFSFNTKPTEAKSAFGFGTKNAESKPAFSFGANSTNENGKPAFSFGSTSNGTADLFGSKESGVKTNGNPPKPAFSFGSNVSESSTPFKFGSTKDSEKPAFSFGTKPNESKPAFNFGASTAAKAGGINGHESEKAGSNLEKDFDFPDIPVQKADVRQEKVKEYEDLFEF